MRRCGKGGRQVTVRVGAAAHLLYRTDPECRAPLRSSQLQRSYQTPGRDTSSVTSAVVAPSSPTGNQTHRRNIFRGKLVCGVRDEQAGFTHSTVTHDNTLDGLHGCVSHSSLLIQDLQQKKSQTERSKVVVRPRWSTQRSIM